MRSKQKLLQIDTWKFKALQLRTVTPVVKHVCGHRRSLWILIVNI